MNHEKNIENQVKNVLKYGKIVEIQRKSANEPTDIN